VDAPGQPGAIMNAVVMRAEQLTKRFGVVTAVDRLDLIVGRGEVFGYLGPNGAGKTTTIRLMLDFVRPTSGSTSLLGGSGADPLVRRRIGYLPADLLVDPRWTARDLLDSDGALRGGHDSAWVATLLDLAGRTSHRLPGAPFAAHPSGAPPVGCWGRGRRIRRPDREGEQAEQP
jgi:ABC-2 type transport system ATP-binding protein